MVNSMIGSGIFTVPGYTVLLTKSKTVALILWVVGGGYTSICMVLFLEYGIALPFNGGALIYLDEVFRHPRLLVTILFSIHRILLASTAGNSRTLAINILSAADRNTRDPEISEGLIKLMAIVVQTAVCLLLFFLRRTCFVWNFPFAVFKVGAVGGLAIFGLVRSRNDYGGTKDFGEKSGYSGHGALSAMTHIIYCYQGFENVNCVAGEIKHVKTKWKWAALTSIVLITILYMLITTAYFVVLDYASLTSKTGLDDISLVFAHKQAIAWQKLIPFYNFFGSGGKAIDGLGGALVLHWIFSVIALAVAPTRTDTRLFASGIYSYGYQLVNCESRPLPMENIYLLTLTTRLVFLAIGFFFLPKKMKKRRKDWKPSILKNKYLRWLVASVFACFNVITLVMSALEKTEGSVPRKYWPISIAVVIAIGLVYWSTFPFLNLRWRDGSRTLGQRIGFQVTYQRKDREPDAGDDNSDPRQEDAWNDIAYRKVDYKVCRTSAFDWIRLILSLIRWEKPLEPSANAGWILLIGSMKILDTQRISRIDE
ncbi:MAG: hypothetical protein Q9214_002607 [Letrouitia sp. 1 TL-2023]